MKINNKFLMIIFFTLTLLIFSNILTKQNGKDVLETFQSENISKKQYVYPLGNIVGIDANTDGALVIGFEDEDI